MCTFSGPVREVSSTQLFARHIVEDGAQRQLLVYGMNVELDDQVAMVLPVPVPPESGDSAVTFVNLQRYPRFFDDVMRAFQPTTKNVARLASSTQSKLVVHNVGAFIASYVPSRAEFARLDPRFCMPPAAFEAMPHYHDWGFAVFQLRPLRSFFGRYKRQTIHPMAFTFPTRRPRALFYPTLHIHDGATVPPKAYFDHHLFCQSSDEILTRTLPWQSSRLPLGAFVNAKRAAGLIEPAAVAFKTRVIGSYPNEDWWCEPPVCSGLHVLSGRGERFAFDIQAYAAYFQTDDDQARAWQRTARTRLDELHAGMMAGLTQMTTARAREWGLASYAENVGERSGVRELRVRASTDRVQEQFVRLVFATPPTGAVLEAIAGEFVHVLERAVP